MKILHTSDWHLGQNFMGKSRVEEHEAFLSWLLNTIHTKQYALKLYYNFLKELSNIKTLITTIITAGNHDNVSTLNQLQNSGKMVGVISHVEALKERIPLQIKVEPKGNGTSVLDIN